MKQYSKRMVIAHWLVLVLVIAAWYLGDSLADATDDSKATITGYVVHLAIGGLILLVTLSRLFFRAKDGVPPPMGVTLTDKVAKGIHHALYTVMVLLPVSGLTTVFTSSVARALMAGDANMLPKEHDFHDVFAHEVHEQLVNILIVLVVIHVLGAIKHQFIMKDGLMERMMLRRKD